MLLTNKTYRGWFNRLIELIDRMHYKTTFSNRDNGYVYEGFIEYLFEDKNSNEKFLAFVVEDKKQSRWYIRGYIGSITNAVLYTISEEKTNIIIKILNKI